MRGDYFWGLLQTAKRKPAEIQQVNLWLCGKTGALAYCLNSYVSAYYHPSQLTRSQKVVVSERFLKLGASCLCMGNRYGSGAKITNFLDFHNIIFNVNLIFCLKSRNFNIGKYGNSMASVLEYFLLRVYLIARIILILLVLSLIACKQNTDSSFVPLSYITSVCQVAIHKRK